MKQRSTLSSYYRPALLLLAVITAACSDSRAPLNAPQASADLQATNPIPGIGDQLGRLRSLTARFHDFDSTTQPGGEYSAQITGCIENKSLGGGMGFHYAKEGTIDGTINPDEPEVLLYEPQKNGKPRLVAVEFLVPFSIVPANGTAPRAFDTDFVPDATFPFWTLHVWLWKNNPSGLFKSFNPNVNCNAVPAAQRQSMIH